MLALTLTLTLPLTLTYILTLYLTLNPHKGNLCPNDCAQVTEDDRTQHYQEYRLIRLDVSHNPNPIIPTVVLIK